MIRVPKQWRLTIPALAAAVVVFGGMGSVRRADAGARAPAVLVGSSSSATRPVPGDVPWFGRMHAEYLKQTKNQKFDLCFLGDSITQGWPGDMFAKYFGKYKPVNFGIGGDRTENVLWRLHHGELKGTSPKLIVLLIGICNAGRNTPQEIAVGVATVVKTLRVMLPQTKILLLGIFPSAKNADRAKTEVANRFLAKLDGKSNGMIKYLDIGSKFLNNDGKILPGVLRDGVHLTRKGYKIWGDAVAPIITKKKKK